MHEIDRIAAELQKQAWAGYSKTLIEHAMRPRNVGGVERPDGYASHLGPCGDNMQIWLRVRNGRVEQATFWADGCGTTIACGSMVTELAKGKPIGEAMRINAEAVVRGLGGLPVDSLHCAGLAATTLKMALVDYINSSREPWKNPYARSTGK